MGVRLLISFDGDDEFCYYPGQIIQGKVTLENNAEIKIKGLTITFFGDAEVYWTEKEAVNDTVSPHPPHRNQDDDYSCSQRHIHREFRNHETILCHEIVLLGQGEAEGGIEFIMPPGTKEYRFQYQLPPIGLPSTFIDLPYGSIRYTAEARLKRPLFRYDKMEKEFVFKEIIDINVVPRVLQPVGVNKRLDFGWMCCLEGHLTVDLQLPKTGYTPGEMLPFTVSIMNLSRASVNQVFATLTQVIQFSTFDRKKIVSSDLQFVSFQSVVEPFGTARWNECFTISSSLRPSTLAGRRIISFHYNVKVTVKASNQCCSVACPIFVGTQPCDVDVLNSVVIQNLEADSPEVETGTATTVSESATQHQDRSLMNRQYNPALNPFLNSESEDDGLHTVALNENDGKAIKDVEDLIDIGD